MNSTFSTVIIPAEVLNEAKTDFPELFTTALSPTSTLPATHYVSSGYFLTEDLERIVNTTSWSRQVLFGDVHQTLSALNLQIINLISE